MFNLERMLAKINKRHSKLIKEEKNCISDISFGIYKTIIKSSLHEVDCLNIFFMMFYNSLFAAMKSGKIPKERVKDSTILLEIMDKWQKNPMGIR